jgi:hypothetical protein
MHPDDERLADLVRHIRRELDLTQVQLAARARVPLCDVKQVEAGRAGFVKLHRVRTILEAEGGRARLVPRWNGAATDRLLDARHAQMVERVVRLLKLRGWIVLAEVSFAEFGERGSIDVLAVRPDVGAVLVIEVKTAIGSLEETNRILDMKVRLAPKIVFKRLGWRPRIVGRLLVVPEVGSSRRTIAQHAETMESIYPARTREVRHWLRRPESDIAGIWFLSIGQTTSTVNG